MVKLELRLLAETLRRQSLSVPAIAAQLGVARSTAFQWTKHLTREARPMPSPGARPSPKP